MLKYLVLYLLGILLVVILCPVGLHSTETDYLFKQIALKEGLSHSSVTCMLHDQKGLMWIGTKSGLNCYDGYEMITFMHEQQNPQSIPGNTIYFLTEDSLNQLWVGTNKGVVRYDPARRGFIPLLYENKTLQVRSALVSDGSVLFGGNGELFRYDVAEDNLSLLASVADSSSFITSFTRLLSLDEHTILAGTRWNGAFEYNKTDHSLRHSSLIPGSSLRAFCRDSKGNIWYSLYNEGIACVDRAGRILHQFSTSNSKLTNNVVLDLLEKDGQLWIATDGGGINLLDLGNLTFSSILHIEGGQFSLPVHSLFCFYNDRMDNLWVGSIRGGLFSIKEVFIHTFRDTPRQNTFGLSERAVLCTYEDTDGTIWVGTDGGGLNVFDPRNNRFKHIAARRLGKVVSIAAYSERYLILSFYGKGVFLFDKKTEAFRPFTIVNETADRRITGGSTAVNILRVEDRMLYFLSDSIYPYDLQQQKFASCPHLEDPGWQNGLRTISSRDGKSYLIGPYYLLELDHHTLQFKVLYTTNEIIQSACSDGAGGFFIGTDESIYRYTPRNGQTDQLENSPFRFGTPLLTDTRGWLWIGAENILFVYIISEDRFIIFGESDGVSVNEFLPKASLQSSSGALYFGGISGLVQVKKDILLNSVIKPQMDCVEVIVDGQSVPSFADSNDHTITIPWDHSSLQIKTITRDKEFFRKKLYRYYLKGETDRFVETFSPVYNAGTLPPGEYTLYAQCGTREGNWNEVEKLLTLRISPPWWKTGWFVASAILLVLLLMASLFYAYIRKKENHLRWQMKEHEQAIYEEKVRFLINISHELRTPLTLIYAPLKRLLSGGRITDPEARQQLSGIFKQSGQMKSIINMVLDIRKMEVGGDSLQIEPYPLNEWLRALSDDFRNEFEANGIHLVLQPDDRVGDIPFDASKCEIILSNLLINALKFSLQDTTVILSTCLMDGIVRISVIDEGIGLQNTDINKLFSRFYQGNHNRGGSGIGLSYARILVEMHGGRIGAMNNEGKKGATFYIDLPVKNNKELLVPEHRPYVNELLRMEDESCLNEKTASAPAFSLSGYTLLVVEDNTEMLEFLREVLSEHFKKVVTAADGVEALEKMEAHHPDLVVSDVMMPRMDGYELCRRIKDNLETSHLPVILLTARMDSNSTLEGYKRGADAYIPKPFDVDLLQTVICNLLHTRLLLRQKQTLPLQRIVPEECTFSNTDEQFLSKLNEQITKYLSDPALDVQLLATEMAVSRSTLYNKVKALTDMGVNDYINKMRLQAASALLLSGNLSIAEISEKTGFSNQRYFSTVFKQTFGSTPSAYRQKASYSL